MRFIVLGFLMSLLTFASEFPDTFNSAGDGVYESMQKYLKIKDLKIYQDRPEFLESFCLDANVSMQKGFALDRAKEDPEAKIDKNLIKSYAKELRRLSNQNEAIEMQLQEDIKKLYLAGDMNSLAQIKEAGFYLDDKILEAIKEDRKQQAVNEAIAKAKLLQAEQKKIAEEIKKPIAKAATVTTKAASTDSAKPVKKAAVSEQVPKAVKPVLPEQVEVIEEARISTEVLASAKREELEAKIKEPARKLTELEYYQQSLANLKEELYTLRERAEGEVSDLNNSLADQTKTACLNDITAINYWMIKVIENEKDACVLSDAIRQMKSYDKSAATSCGRDSMRYIEWHGRIKPYVGNRLFQAEALCHR